MAAKNGVTVTTQIVSFNPEKAKIVQRLVCKPLSIRNMKEGDTLYIRAEGEPVVKDTTGQDGKPSSITTIMATDLRTGEVGELVLPVVARRGFEAAAAQGPLKGRLFAMQKGSSTGAGKCNRWEVVEFAIDA